MLPLNLSEFRTLVKFSQVRNVHLNKFNEFQSHKAGITFEAHDDGVDKLRVFEYFKTFLFRLSLIIHLMSLDVAFVKHKVQNIDYIILHSQWLLLNHFIEGFNHRLQYQMSQFVRLSLVFLNMFQYKLEELTCWCIDSQDFSLQLVIVDWVLLLFFGGRLDTNEHESDLDKDVKVGNWFIVIGIESLKTMVCAALSGWSYVAICLLQWRFCIRR